MNELEFLKKRKGMTIGIAWLLMFFSMLSVVLVGYLMGLYIMSNSINVRSSDLLDYSSVALVISFFIYSIVGFFLNQKEFPKNNKITLKVLIITIIIGLLWSFLSSLLTEHYVINVDMFKQRKITGTWWFGLILSSAMAIFQIGILGHGLLRNYPFNKALVAVSFVCIAYYIPVAVVSMVIQTSLLFLIYYRTGSFFLVLSTSWIIQTIDYFLRELLNIQEPNFNYYKQTIFQSASTYYIFCILAFLLLLGSMLVLKRISPKIQWQKDDSFSIF
ncbi:hypothetical protein [Lacihabitans soyangensis]|nr:hypothetical protein [Lacihabitans soyangensis]